ncbi:ComEA family DNA-binding protein [Saccharicrinis fermentans]|uniref:Helix-hairpin-helix motif n=1 Tax=Saccharicrinis fermentans DSM 9555 = JCM 21142 TaxID=869213 RepID=W7XWY5_9BACT|nr:helix-hairpin-helix domain-containing protein [Saccharicrinis fermentans]GAF02915.1 helix-hairpin-helix motif [Saccharicrinis fermentans DSM 9555 = JCM 21142]
MKQKLLTFILLLFIINLHAQTPRDPSQVIEEILESISEKDINLNDQSQLFDELIELYERPININTMKTSDLEKLIFLSDLQIQRIKDYVQKMGPVHSKFQLQAIPGLTRTDIERLMMFVKMEPQYTIQTPYRYINGQLILRNQFDVEKARGYTIDTTATHYEGNRHHSYAKMQLQYGDHWSAGAVLDKDPGESLFPMDFISAYAMRKSDQLIKTLIIGDYHANFGQGLALWTGTSMGKTSEALGVRKRSNGFNKYASSNEYAFFRGVATTLAYKNMELSLFGSHKNRDADIKINEDSSLHIVESMPTTGYHRTPNEINKKNKLGQSTFGANLEYQYKKFSLSMGGFSQRYDADSIAVKQLYQLTAHEKTETSHYWVSYHYAFNKALSFGELAMDDNGDIALTNGLLLRPVDNVSLALSYRYFSNKYYSPWTNAISENSLPAGESGFYMGIKALPLSKTQLLAYVDIFKTNCPKYNIDGPFNGYDVSFQADYEFSQHFKLYVRYREKEKSKNSTSQDLPDYTTTTSNTRKIRLHTDFEVDANWTLQMRIEKSFYKETNEGSSEGILAYSGIKYTQNKMSCWLRYSVFDTDNYNTRLYAYENDLLYNFYTPAFQGEGSRFYGMVSYQLAKKIKLWIKAGRTRYYDRDEIGSGLQTIPGQSRTNIRMQIQIKL